MDEFKVNYKTINYYGWSKKDISGWKSLSSQPFEMIFIVCFSKNSIECLTGFKKTINENKVRKFIDEALISIQERYALSSMKIAIV